MKRVNFGKYTTTPTQPERELVRLSGSCSVKDSSVPTRRYVVPRWSRASIQKLRESWCQSHARTARRNLSRSGDGHTFGRVVAPLMGPDIISGWVMLFVLSAGEVTASVMSRARGLPSSGSPCSTSRATAPGVSLRPSARSSPSSCRSSLARCSGSAATREGAGGDRNGAQDGLLLLPLICPRPIVLNCACGCGSCCSSGRRVQCGDRTQDGQLLANGRGLA